MYERFFQSYRSDFFFGGFRIVGFRPQLFGLSLVIRMSQKFELTVKTSIILDKIVTFSMIKILVEYFSSLKKPFQHCEELKHNHLSKMFSFDKIVLKVLSDFVNLHSSTFSKLDAHGYEVSQDLISSLCIRLKYHAKLENRQFRKNYLRSKLNRLTIVQNN